jgi:hypothetical protein
MAGTPGWYTKLSQSGAVDATHARNDSWQLSRLPSRRASDEAGIVHIPTISPFFRMSLLAPYSQRFEQ